MNMPINATPPERPAGRNWIVAVPGWLVDKGSPQAVALYAWLSRYQTSDRAAAWLALPDAEAPLAELRALGALQGNELCMDDPNPAPWQPGPEYFE